MDYKIIDFHTHAFADSIADRAMGYLANEVAGVKSFLDGKLSSLLESMDRADIERSVLCPIATKPKQFEGIIKWGSQIRSSRIIPLGSVHPDDEHVFEHIDQIYEAGFPGLKMHPYYQSFFLDEPRMLDIYARIADHEMFVVMHTGFDVAYPAVKRADPPRILRVVEQLPGFKLITTHLGAWRQWEQVADLMVGKEIFMELSYTQNYLEPDKMRNILINHPPEYLLFGTDSPWADQKGSIEYVKSLNIGSERERMLFRDNALRLLDK